MFIDNLSAKYFIANLVMHVRMKHVEIYFYFIKDLVVNSTLDVKCTPFDDKVGDAITPYDVFSIIYLREDVKLISLLYTKL